MLTLKEKLRTSIFLYRDDSEVEELILDTIRENTINKLSENPETKIIPILTQRYNRRTPPQAKVGEGKINFFKEQLGHIPTKEYEDSVEEYIDKNELLIFYDIYLKLRSVSYSYNTLKNLISEDKTPKENIKAIKEILYVMDESKINTDNLNESDKRRIAEIITNGDISDLDYMLFGYRLKEGYDEKNGVYGT